MTGDEKIVHTIIRSAVAVLKVGALIALIATADLYVYQWALLAVIALHGKGLADSFVERSRAL